MTHREVACAVMQNSKRYLLLRAENAAPANPAADQPTWSLPCVTILPGGPGPAHALSELVSRWHPVDAAAFRLVHTLERDGTLTRIYCARPTLSQPSLDSDAAHYCAWLTQEEIAIWHIAGRMQNSTDLDIITICSKLIAPDH